MSSVTVPVGTPATLPRWSLLAFAAALALLWLVTMEAGVVSSTLGQANSFLHEFFHDGRHLIGVPCH